MSPKAAIFVKGLKMLSLHTDNPASGRMHYGSRFCVALSVFLMLITSQAGCASVGESASQSNSNPDGRATSDANAFSAVEMDIESRRAALDKLADLLEKFYIFPDQGLAYAGHLRQRNLDPDLVDVSAGDFAEKITEELQRIHVDGHLRVEVVENNGSPSAPMGAMPPKSLKAALHPTEDISYIRLDTLWGDAETMDGLAEFVDKSISTKVIIIDLRANRGGGLEEMDFLFSEMFSEKQDLLIMEIRREIYENEGAPFAEGPALRQIDSPPATVHLLHSALPAENPRLANVSLYVLTSGTTASAAEHFALALKRTGRATLIGEPTKGAAHFGGMMPIGEGLQAFIPVGRTFDPDNGESWEGTGVIPDIAVDVDNALMRALQDFGLSETAAYELNQKLTTD